MGCLDLVLTQTISRGMAQVLSGPLKIDLNLLKVLTLSPVSAISARYMIGRPPEAA